MDILPISNNDIRFFDTSGKLIAAPSEWLPALLEIPLSQDQWEQVEVRLQDHPVTVNLRRFNGVSRILAEWPRTGSGNYRLSYRAESVFHEQVVTINPQKISLDAYMTMLDDLQNKLPGAIALALKSVGGLSGVKLLPASDSTFAQELQRLKRAILGTPKNPGLLHILPNIAKNPHVNLNSREIWTKSELARAPHPVRLFQALQDIRNLDDQKRPLQVLDTRNEHTFDIYENQLLKTYCQEVSQRLYRLKNALLKVNLTNLYWEANGLLIRLNLARREAAFLDEVSLPDFCTFQGNNGSIKKPGISVGLARLSGISPERRHPS